MTGPVWDGKGIDPWLPQRLQARLDVAATERDIRAAFWAALSDWLVQTSRRVLRGDTHVPDPDAIWARVPAWRDAVDAILHGEIFQAIGLAYHRLLGKDYPYGNRSFVTRYLAEVRNRMVRLPEEVFDLVAGQIAAGTNLGESIPELAKRVDNVLSTTASERWPNRATVVARTECLPGEAMVNGAYVTSAYRRWYSGPMVTIETMGGRQFTGTPNHPVLTSNGWVGLGALLEGDHLVCDSESVQAAGAPGDQDVNTGQATIAEIFHAAQTVAIPCRERTGQPDFHGDGQDGYVDVLRSFGVLPIGRFASISKGSVDLILSPSDTEKVTLACERAPFARSAPIDQTSGLLGVPPNVSGLFNKALDDLQISAVFGRELLSGGSCPVPGHDLLTREVCSEGRALAATIEETATGVGEGSQYAALEQDRSHLIGSEPGMSGHSPVAQPGEVELDEIISIEVSDWSGHVFNLTTVDGYFVSGGVYTGNTIGALNAGRSDAFTIVADDSDTELENFWLATEDHRTRRTHLEAEGQRVPVGRPFTVGGFHLRFPGDPEGPAKEVIQCVPGDTVVWFPGIRSAMRRWYEGEMVTIELATGDQLTITPNHPVLRSDGEWVAAGLLQEGDQCVRYTGGRGTLAQPHPQHGPAEIGQVYRTARLASVPNRVSLSPPDLHGDRPYGDVEVVPAHGQLLFDDEPATDEQVRQFGLSTADLARLPERRTDGRPLTSRTTRGEVNLATSSDMGCLGDGATFGRGGALETESIGLASTTDLQTELSEPSSHHPAIDAQVTTDAENAVAPLISLGEIVKVNRSIFTGHVFNLDTGDGWYSANSIITRNCRCTMLLVEIGETVDLSNRQFKRRSR